MTTKFINITTIWVFYIFVAGTTSHQVMSSTICRLVQEVQAGDPKYKNFNLPLGERRTFNFSMSATDGLTVNNRSLHLIQTQTGLHFSIPVNDPQEAQAIFNQLIHHFPPANGKRVLKRGETVIGIPGMMRGDIIAPTDEMAHNFGTYSLEISFEIGPTHENLDEIFLKSLLENKYLSESSSVIPFDSDLAKNDWAIHHFESWALARTTDENEALEAIGNTPYRGLHRYLRESKSGNEYWDNMIRNLDSAMEGSVVNRPLTVYRADANPDLLHLWETMSTAQDNGHIINIPLPIDKAYSFTSLSPKVADWWNVGTLKKAGIILEIEMPAGARAIYLDASVAHKNRGFMEMILPRGSKYEATGAYIRDDGQKVLKVRLL